MLKPMKQSVDSKKNLKNTLRYNAKTIIFTIICLAAVVLIKIVLDNDEYHNRTSIPNSMHDILQINDQIYEPGQEKKANTSHTISNTKTILFWNDFFGHKDYYFGVGKTPFLRNKCRVYDCYITYDRHYKAVENFDGIVFHGPEYHPKKKWEKPQTRNSFQTYAFFSMEAPVLFSDVPMVDFNFFNVTMTYRLDSDILIPYYQINEKNENVDVRVAPATSPKWIKPEFNPAKLKRYQKMAATKRRPAAWFVTNCNSRNNREGRVRRLQEYIEVDVYGKCGTYDCPRSKDSDCLEILKRDYYFYLAYENSNCLDYVTEKMFNHGLQNDVVPVVLGGADYNKFAPPHSYISAVGISPKKLAEKLRFLMENPAEYAKYFWWRDFYRVASPINSFCLLCEYLHSLDRTKWKSYENFIRWWHGSNTNPTCYNVYYRIP